MSFLKSIHPGNPSPIMVHGPQVNDPWIEPNITGPSLSLIASGLGLSFLSLLRLFVCFLYYPPTSIWLRKTGYSNNWKITPPTRIFSFKEGKYFQGHCCPVVSHTTLSWIAGMWYNNAFYWNSYPFTSEAPCLPFKLAVKMGKWKNQGNVT